MSDRNYTVPSANRNPKDHLISRLILNQKCTSILLDTIENYYEFRLINSLFNKCRSRINAYSIDRFNQNILFDNLMRRMTNNEQRRLDNYLESIEQNKDLMFARILNNENRDEREYEYDEIMEKHRLDNLYEISRLILKMKKNPSFEFDLDPAIQVNKLIYYQHAQNYLADLFKDDDRFKELNVDEILSNFELIINCLIKELKSINSFLNGDSISIENDNLDRAISFKFNLIIQHEFLDFVIKSARNAI